MTRLWTIALAFVVTACVGATPSPNATHGTRSEPRATHEEPGTLPAGLDDQPDILTLPAAVALALLGSPALAEYSWQVRADEARMVQAGLRPNPEARLYAEDFYGTGRFRDGNEAQITLELSQAVELGGKRAARVAAATRLRDVATRDYEVQRVQVLADVTRRFIELLSAQAVLRVAKTNLGLGEQTLEATVQLVKAGAGSALDERKARIEVARARIVAEHAGHEVAAARRELAATWGSATPRFERVEGDLFARKPVPTYEQLAEQVDHAPEMVRMVAEQQLREAEVELADAYRVPTPSVSLGIRRLEARGDEAMVFGLSVPLPTSDRNQGRRSEARALLARTEQGSRATDVRIRTALFSLHQELRHASTALDSLEQEILPQAEESLALSRRGFTDGRFSYLELADAQRTLFAVERERIETAASYHRIVLEIERLTGEPIETGSARGEAVAP